MTQQTEDMLRALVSVLDDDAVMFDIKEILYGEGFDSEDVELFYDEMGIDTGSL